MKYNINNFLISTITYFAHCALPAAVCGSLTVQDRSAKRGRKRGTVREWTSEREREAECLPATWESEWDSDWNSHWGRHFCFLWARRGCRPSEAWTNWNLLRWHRQQAMRAGRGGAAEGVGWWGDTDCSWECCCRSSPWLISALPVAVFCLILINLSQT